MSKCVPKHTPELLTCDADGPECDDCRGEIHPVKVVWPREGQTYDFNYCDGAIEADLERGFEVYAEDGIPLLKLSLAEAGALKQQRDDLLEALKAQQDPSGETAEALIQRHGYTRHDAGCLWQHPDHGSAVFSTRLLLEKFAQAAIAKAEGDKG